MEGWKRLQEVGKRKDEFKRYENLGIAKNFLLEGIGCRKYRKGVLVAEGMKDGGSK
jgi:hypothetical protein